MTVQTVKTHPKPKPNTKVRVIKGIDEGQVRYVASYGQDEPDMQLVIAEEPDQYHGFFIQAWELVDEDPLAELTPEQKQAVTDKVLAAAKARGYCAETKNILGDLGLPTKTSPVVQKFSVEVEIRLSEGETFDPTLLVYNGDEVVHARLS